MFLNYIYAVDTIHLVDLFLLYIGNIIDICLWCDDVCVARHSPELMRVCMRRLSVAVRPRLVFIDMPSCIIRIISADPVSCFVDAVDVFV